MVPDHTSFYAVKVYKITAMHGGYVLVPTIQSDSHIYYIKHIKM